MVFVLCVLRVRMSVDSCLLCWTMIEVSSRCRRVCLKVLSIDVLKSGLSKFRKIELA